MMANSAFPCYKSDKAFLTYYKFPGALMENLNLQEMVWKVWKDFLK